MPPHLFKKSGVRPGRHGLPLRAAPRGQAGEFGEMVLVVQVGVHGCDGHPVHGFAIQRGVNAFLICHAGLFLLIRGFKRWKKDCKINRIAV